VNQVQRSVLLSSDFLYGVFIRYFVFLDVNYNSKGCYVIIN